MQSIFENLLLKFLNRDIARTKHDRYGKGDSILSKQAGQSLNRLSAEPKGKPTPHHRRPLRSLGMTDMARKSQNLIAQVHKPDMEEVPLVRTLLDKPSGFGVLQSPTHIQMIIKRWNLKDLDNKNPKMLGNTGIMIYFDPNQNSYCLRKGGNNGGGQS